MTGHALFIVHRTLPGQREAVNTIWRRHMAPAIEANGAHLAYYYCFDEADPDVLRVFQLYTDEDAAQGFLDHPSYRAYLEEVESLLAGPPEVSTATVAWRKAP